MSSTSLEAKIRRHWTTYLPAKVRALKAESRLSDEILANARLAEAEIETLMKAGYQYHEAEEVALRTIVYVRPEPGAGIPPDQRAESEQLEAEYQKTHRP